MYCPNCGALTSDNARFCPKCGTPITKPKAASPAAPSGYQNSAQQQGHQANPPAQRSAPAQQSSYAQQSAPAQQSSYAQQSSRAQQSAQAQQRPYAQQSSYAQQSAQAQKSAPSSGASSSHAYAAATRQPVRPTPSASQSQLTPVGGRRAIKTDRSLLMYILLSIVTCLIYSYYFIYQLAQDVNEMFDDDDEKTGGLLVYILLSFVTCGFYSYYWQYKIANRLARNAPRFGITLTENGSTVLMWDIVGLLLCGAGPFIAMNIIITNTNRLAIAYNRMHGLNYAAQA